MRTAKILGTTALLAVLGLAAGCGSDDPASDGTSSAPDSMSTSPQVAPPTSSAPTTSTSSSATASTPTLTAPTSTAASSSSAPVDIAQPPTSYAEAQAHIQAARTDGTTSSLTRFSTPGDSIYCVLKKSKYLDPSCELRSGAIKDPQVCGQAPSQFVGRVSIRQSGAEPECNTDTIRRPGADTVQPTSLVTSGNIACVVEAIGVTCIDSSLGKGFFLTPGDYAVF